MALQSSQWFVFKIQFHFSGQKELTVVTGYQFTVICDWMEKGIHLRAQEVWSLDFNSSVLLLRGNLAEWNRLVPVCNYIFCLHRQKQAYKELQTYAKNVMEKKSTKKELFVSPLYFLKQTCHWARVIVYIKKEKHVGTTQRQYKYEWNVHLKEQTVLKQI